MFRPGTISQIAVGLLSSLISYRVFAYYEPYVEDDDDIVSEVAQTQLVPASRTDVREDPSERESIFSLFGRLVVVFFYAMMIYASVEAEEQDGLWSGRVFAILLVILLASVWVIAVWLIIVSSFGEDDRGLCFSSARRRVRELPALLSQHLTKAPDADGPDADGPDADVPKPAAVAAGEVEARVVPRDAARTE